MTSNQLNYCRKMIIIDKVNCDVKTDWEKPKLMIVKKGTAEEN